MCTQHAQIEHPQILDLVHSQYTVYLTDPSEDTWKSNNMNHTKWST